MPALKELLYRNHPLQRPLGNPNVTALNIQGKMARALLCADDSIRGAFYLMRTRDGAMGQLMRRLGDMNRARGRSAGNSSCR